MVKKIKNSWTENRVLFVLTSILIICVILIGFVVIDYFLGTKKDKYGDRLENLAKNAITDKEKNAVEKSLEDNEKVSNATINSVGKIIYITIEYNDSIGLNEAQAIANASLEQFSEKHLKFYDINYTIKQEKSDSSDGFLLMGAKNVNSAALSWTNDTPIVEDGE